jgi:hypothetical protein
VIGLSCFFLQKLQTVIAIAITVCDHIEIVKVWVSGIGFKIYNKREGSDNFFRDRKK